MEEKSFLRAPDSEIGFRSTTTPSSGSTADGIKRYSRREIQDIGHMVTDSDGVEIPEEIIRREDARGMTHGGEKEGKDNWRTRNSPPRQQLDRGDRRKQKTKELEVPIEPLVASASSWSVNVKGDISDDQKKIRQIKSILNKLTLEKYDSLYAKLIELEIESKTHVEELIKDLFLKATTQHHFIEMYTRLCYQFSEYWSNKKMEELQEAGEDEDAQESKKAKNEFKYLLISRCQDLFEKMATKPEGLDEIEDEEARFEAHVLWKKKMIGNVKFVGQLMNRNMLSKSILVKCTSGLLENGASECLETLAAFLHTIGPEFDKDDFKKKDELDKCFNKVKKLSEDTVSYSMRIRTLLLDVLDQRAKGWPNCSTGPQKLDEVKEVWAQEHGLNKERSGATIPKVEKDPEEFQVVKKGRKGR